jgi:hypothetical protein
MLLFTYGCRLRVLGKPIELGGKVHNVADSWGAKCVDGGAVGPDQGTGGPGVDQWLIPEEPMSIVLNLRISGAWVRSAGWLNGG